MPFALALAGCMNLAPELQRPALPVAPAYPAATLPSDPPGALAAAEIDWRQFFVDPRLVRLIDLALVANRDLRVAVLTIEQARAAYRIVRADELPSVGVGGVAQRGASGGSVGNAYSVGLQVTSFELDVFGRVRNASQAALAQFLATEEARKTVQISLVSSVAIAYLNLLADDEVLRVTQATLATREDSYRLARLRFENGASSELDAAQAEQLLENARATLAAAQRQRLQDENALVLLIGQPLPADLPAARPLDVGQQLLSDLPSGLPSDLLARRPDVRAAEQDLVAANANIGVARAAFFPRIALTANAGTASAALSGLFQSGTWAFTGTGQLLQPLFDAGRNRAGLESARAGLDIAAARYEQSIQSAFREVADALAGRATLGEQLRAQRAQAQAAQVAYRLADLRYRAGASSYLDVLDAQRTLFAAQQATIQVQALQVQNGVTLYKVLGGGWSESTPERGGP